MLETCANYHLFSCHRSNGDRKGLEGGYETFYNQKVSKASSQPVSYEEEPI
jgi:hypothetical protein